MSSMSSISSSNSSKNTQGVIRMTPQVSNLPPISPASTPSGPSDAKHTNTTNTCVSSAGVVVGGPVPPPPPASSPYSSSPFSSPASSLHKSATHGPLEFLPPDYEPGHWDVICQRGKTCDDHIGNRRFRLCVENHVQAYMNASNRQAKSDVISAVVRSIQRSTGKKGGFVMKDPKTKRWHHVDSKVTRDKVGNALRDAVKQKLEESTEDKLLGGFEQAHSSASFLSETSGGGKSTSIPSMVASNSLLNDSFKWNDSSSNNVFSLHGNDSFSTQSSVGDRNQSSSTFSNFAPQVAAAMSCPSLMAAATAYHNSHHHRGSTKRPSGLSMFGNKLRTSHPTRSRSIGLTNESWNNIPRIQSNRFLQNTLQNHPNHHGDQLLGMMNWNSVGNLNNSNLSYPLGHSSAPTVQGLHGGLTMNLTDVANHNDNTALHDTLLSSEIGELQISNSNHMMDCCTISGPDSAEQLTKDIEEFLKSVRSTTQQRSEAVEERDLIMKNG